MGALVAGPVSDKYMGGRRIPVALATTVVLFVYLCFVLPGLGPETPKWILSVSGLVAGSCVNGQRSLLILSTREQVPTSAGGKADAIVNALAELGGVLAGYPLIRFIQYASWDAFATGGAAVSLVLLALNLVLVIAGEAPPRVKPKVD